ncbi:ribonuclease P protein component [Georgenia halophila]|uniref:Ribonuclease P protein component n=2 Tax=Georgenia halophila TaxID=620889 RepID=A0ABP8LAX9_9MICO
MRRSVDFTDAVRRGARGGSRRLVVHLTGAPPTGDRESAVLVGFVVSKAVGIAVRRNEVKRRLRGLMAERVDALVPGSRIVVRALPASAGASSAALAEDLDAAIATARRRSRTTAGNRR